MVRGDESGAIYENDGNEVQSSSEDDGSQGALGSAGAHAPSGRPNEGRASCSESWSRESSGQPGEAGLSACLALCTAASAAAE